MWSIAKNSFIGLQKLTDVKGRIDYISSPDRQENLYATYRTSELDFWNKLSEESQRKFSESGTDGKCVEARELIIALPEQFVRYNSQDVIERFTEKFKAKYQVECVSALHYNKTKTNYHIHLTFSERRLLEVPEVKIARRKMFYDENGKHVRTKKEVLDEGGNIRSGCSFVSKGEVYEQQLFSTKDARFKSKEFLQEEKEAITKLINAGVKDEKQKLQVFKSNGVYLPTKKIGKNNPKEAEIIADNKARQEWNYSVDEALIVGIDESRVSEVKKEEITDKVKASIEQNGNRPGLFRRIIEQAITHLKKIIEKWKAPAKPVMKFDIKVFNKLEAIRAKLDNGIEKIRIIEKQVIPELERQLKNVSGWGKGKKRAEIEDKIKDKKAKLLTLKQSLERIVQSEGYEDISEFVKVYNKSASEMLKYNKAMEKYKKHGGEMPDKESLHKKLEKAKQEVRERNVKVPVKKKIDRGAR